MINGNTNIGGETYSNKFNYDLPKKQAKSYEIDLGQNVLKYLIINSETDEIIYKNKFSYFLSFKIKF